MSGICDTLKLDSYDVEISFPISKKEIIETFIRNNISIDMPTEKQIIVKSKLLSLDYDFFMCFYFNGEKLDGITLLLDEYLEGRGLYDRYRKVQKALENEWGRSYDLIQSIVNCLNPDGYLMRWKSNTVVAEHYLLNHFGVEEHIDIRFL